MRLFNHQTPGDLITKAIKAEADAEQRYADLPEGTPLHIRGKLTDLSNRALAARRTLEYHGKVEVDAGDVDEWAGL